MVEEHIRWKLLTLDVGGCGHNAGLTALAGRCLGCEACWCVLYISRWLPFSACI